MFPVYIYIHQYEMANNSKTVGAGQKNILQAYGFPYALYTIQHDLDRLLQPVWPYKIFCVFWPFFLYTYLHVKIQSLWGGQRHEPIRLKFLPQSFSYLCTTFPHPGYLNTNKKCFSNRPNVQAKTICHVDQITKPYNYSQCKFC